MAGKSDTYRAELAALKDWDGYLLKHSGLPGPRANLELVGVVAEMGTEAQFKEWMTYDAMRAPANSREEYLALCGTVGLGRLIAEGKTKCLKSLRKAAADPRWRVREGVAMALQRWGDADFGGVIDALEGWRGGNLYEQRAIAAGLCEPRLLQNPAEMRRVLRLLDGITRDFSKAKDKKSNEYIALKKGLSYCWSVAVAAAPIAGKKAMGKWFASDDAGVRAVMRENLRKDRLKRMDAQWAAQGQAHLGDTG